MSYINNSSCAVFRGQELAKYNFGDTHPFGPNRHKAFQEELISSRLSNAITFFEPSIATIDQLLLFHTADYINYVSKKSSNGHGYLDGGDTPAFKGVMEASSYVVGTTLSAIDLVMANDVSRAFIPIAGLHHAGRDYASGFCVFNDCGVAIEYLREQYNIKKIAYVDIDAHHGDGVFYAFEKDPNLIFADIHEDGNYLYPGTGSIEEIGKGLGKGAKINIPIAPGSNDKVFMDAWNKIVNFIDEKSPEFIIMQCGADCLSGDPLTHLELTEEIHAIVARDLCMLADKHCDGKIIGAGGGGYDLNNVARAWTRVVQEFLR